MSRRTITTTTTTTTAALRRLFLAAAAGCCLAAAGAGCERNDMHNQPRHEPMEQSNFFADGQSSRPLVAGTIARGQLMPNDLRYAGLAVGPTPDAFPFEITKADLRRGKQRYEIYCGVCHGVAGDADGMIVRRGFVKPPSFHEQRLKDAPAGHFYDVITNGFGAMYSYNDRIFPEDRWRIAAYVRVLQLAQNDAVAAAGGIAPRAMASPQPGAPGDTTDAQPASANVPAEQSPKPQAAEQQPQPAQPAPTEQQEQPKQSQPQPESQPPQQTPDAAKQPGANP
jgi:mono/diheme cytochrome c family protein